MYIARTTAIISAIVLGIISTAASMGLCITHTSKIENAPHASDIKKHICPLKLSGRLL